MFRSSRSFTPTSYYVPRWQESWTRLLAPLALWICVSISLQYGYYGNYKMVLGPSSSRLLSASPLFVKQIEVRDDEKKGVLIYSFADRPGLDREANWTVNKYLVVGSYSSQGVSSLWLNQGSQIHMRWEAGGRTLSHVQVVILKGERKYENLLPNSVTSVDDGLSSMNSSSNSTEGVDAAYVVLDDDKYYVNVINMSPISIMLTIKMNVSAKLHDTSKASSMCSTEKGSCRLNVAFPNTRFVILTTPNNGDLGGWYLELSFVARAITYIAILGLVGIVIFLILKHLGACNNTETQIEEVTRQDFVVVIPERPETSETDPLLPKKPIGSRYGAIDEENLDSDSSNDSSSDELYDGKICVICYDHPRNCFFVPCGHCATCYDCAQRIMEGESKVCPICRRIIHKLRKLFTP
ncbi:hypothetical protein Droror1_Dr00010192 [Drosera rotundifolia]